MLDAFELKLLAHVNQHSGQKLDSLWQMINGYAPPSAGQLYAINRTLEQLSQSDIHQLISTIKIGAQYDTEVTLKALDIL